MENSMASFLLKRLLSTNHVWQQRWWLGHLCPLCLSIFSFWVKAKYLTWSSNSKRVQNQTSANKTPALKSHTVIHIYIEREIHTHTHTPPHTLYIHAVRNVIILYSALVSQVAVHPPRDLVVHFKHAHISGLLVLFSTDNLSSQRRRMAKARDFPPLFSKAHARSLLAGFTSH